MLVTQRPAAGDVINPVRPGSMRLATQDGVISAPIAGLPKNVGMLDVTLHPQFATNGFVYASYMERDPKAPRIGRNAADTRVDPAGLAVVRLHLAFDDAGTPRFDAALVVWRQMPKVVNFPGTGEPGGRMAFSPDGRYLFIAAGDRQEFDPVQTLDNTLGKIVRIFPDGRIPPRNPFATTPDARADIWTLGHRNPYGLAFDATGRLWSNEMGPMGGDELNLVVPGANYGWPRVSYGDYYTGNPIPRPSPGDGFEPSIFTWTPVIAPAGMIFYSGALFPEWHGMAIIPGLVSKGLVVVSIDGGTHATEVQRVPLDQRIRGIAQGPDGALWVLEDQPTGRLIRLDPVR